MKFLKRYKVLILVIIFFGLLMGAIVFVTTLLPSYTTSVYGNRLDGIDKVSIKSATKDDMITTIKKETWVTDASMDVNGKIINIVIKVKVDANRDTAKAFAATLLSKFSAEEKAFYDIQVFIGLDSKETSEIYPVIGYKNAKNESFVWSNN